VDRAVEIVFSQQPPLDFGRHLPLLRERSARRELHQHKCECYDGKERGDCEEKSPNGLCEHPNVLIAPEAAIEAGRTLRPW
jgi:hypothetical protein